MVWEGSKKTFAQSAMINLKSWKVILILKKFNSIIEQLQVWALNKDGYESKLYDLLAYLVIELCTESFVPIFISKNLRGLLKEVNEKIYLNNIKAQWMGAPGWLSQLSFWLQLRSWSHGLWVQAPHQALCGQPEPAWDCLSPSLSAPPLRSLSQK